MVEKQPGQPVTASAERRKEPRIAAAKAVVLRVPEGHPLEVWLLEISSKGARVRGPQPVEAGTPIRIESQDVLLFGNVVRSHMVRGAYEIGIEFSLPLDMLTELRKLNAALLGELESMN
jgi:hypothetical protein